MLLLFVITHTVVPVAWHEMIIFALLCLKMETNQTHAQFELGTEIGSYLHHNECSLLTVY